MSRQIKFRAWDNKFRCMDYDLWMHFNSSIYDYPSRTYDTANTEIELADAFRFEVMQFTGLLDVNGKPIFEGDVVRETFKHIPYELAGKIVYLETHAAFAIDYGDDTLLFSDENILEVIGNIYESK